MDEAGPAPRCVLNPHLAVGFVDGTIWLSAGEAVHASRDPGLLRLLARFLTPEDPRAALAGEAAGGAAERHLRDLLRIRALLPVDGDGAPADAEGGTGDEAPGLLVDTDLAPIALTLDALSSTLAALSPAVGRAIREETGLGLGPRLMACRAAVAGLRREVERRIPDYVAAQVARLPASDRPLSLHLGAGASDLPGWVSVDVWPAPLSIDLRWGLPFAEASAERVYLAHTLEHLWYPGEVMALLREIHRVLAPGGRVRIVVPDIELALRAYVADDRAVIEGRARTAWPDWTVSTRLESVLGYAGVGPHPGRFAEAHKFGYDAETLAHILAEAGFRDIRRCGYQASSDPGLRIDDASAFAGAEVDGRHYSLFVEAVR